LQGLKSAEVEGGHPIVLKQRRPVIQDRAGQRLDIRKIDAVSAHEAGVRLWKR
jgi:hypothetical protein